MTDRLGREFSDVTAPYPFLGRVALGAQMPIVVKLSPWTICRSVCPVHCGKTADRIRQAFGIISRPSPGMRQVVGFGDRRTGRDTSGGKFGARHCNQWGLYGVRVRQRRDAALFPNYFGQTCFRPEAEFGARMRGSHSGFASAVLTGIGFTDVSLLRRGGPPQQQRSHQPVMPASQQF